MAETLSQYSYYLNIGLLAVLGLFVLGGLIAGLKRSLISFSLLVVLVVALFYTLNPLCNFLLDLEIGQMGITTFRELITNTIVDNVPEISTMMVEGNQVYELVMSLTVTVMRFIVFFVGSLLIIFIIEPFLRIFVRLIFGVRRKSKRRFRLVGAVVNGLKGLFIITLMLFPISGVFSVAKDLETVVQVSGTQEMALLPMAQEDSNEELDELFEIIEIYDNLTVKKIINFSKFFLKKPLDEYIFNKTLRLKHNGKKAYLIDDLKEVVKVASVILKYTENGNSFDIYQVSAEDLTMVVNALKNIKIIDIVLPVAVEVALNLDEVKDFLDEYNINKDDLKNLNWSGDFDTLLDVAKEVILLGELNKDSLLDLDVAKVRSITTKLASTSILQYALPIGLDYLLDMDEVKKYLGEDFAFNYDEIDFTAEIGVIVDVFEQIKKIGVDDFDFDKILRDDEKYNAMLTIIDKLADSNLLNQALPKLADGLMKEQLDNEIGKVINIGDVDNIAAEVSKILKIIKDLKALGIDITSGNFDDIDFDSLDTDQILDIIDQIFALEVFDEEELFRALFKELKIEVEDDYDFGDIDAEKQAIKNVVSDLVIFIKEAKTTKFDDFENIIKNQTNRENLLDVIESASESKVMVEIVLKLFKDLLSENMPEELKDLIDISKLPAASWRSETEKLLDIFLDITEANLFGEGDMNLNNDLIIRIIRNIFDLELIKSNEEKIFKELFKMMPVIDEFTPNYENIDWTTEPDNIIMILEALSDIGEISDFDFNEIDTLAVDKITNLIKAINHSQLFRPMLLQVIDKQIDNNSVSDWMTTWFSDQINGEMAPVEDWDNEIDYLARLVVNLASFDLNGFDIQNASEEDIQTLGNILKDINRSKIFNLNKITSLLEVSDTGSILYGADFSNLPTTEEAWDSEIDVLMEVLKWFCKAQPIGMDKYVEIGKLLNAIKASTIIGPNFDNIIEKATEQLDDQFASYVDLSKVNLKAINWETELQTLFNIYSAFGGDAGSSSFTDLADRVANSGDQSAILDLLQNINNSDLLRQMLPKMIHEALTTVNLADWEADWFKNQYAPDGVMADKTTWADELNILAHLIATTVGFNINNFDMENSSNEDINTLGAILTDINHSQIFNINKITTILEISDPNSILYGADFSNLPISQAAWDDEISTLVDALKQLKAIKPIDMEKHAEIGKLLNIIKVSVILGPNLNLVIENSLEQLDDEFMTYVDLSSIDTSTLDWVVELDALDKLFDDFNNFTGVGFSLDTLLANTISDIMNKASHSVITTQIFGKLINEQLDALLGRHNPTDEHGDLIYDYTKQEVLGGNADDVGQLIEFGKMIKALFQNSDDAVQGVAVGMAIKDYKVEEGVARPTFADVYFPAIIAYANNKEADSPLDGIDMTTVDYEVEGQYFIDFFEAEGYSEKEAVLREIMTSSTLTRLIMLAMGISLL